jgi:hypothetical protein
MALADILFIIMFVGAIIAFFVGLGVGLLHNRQTQSHSLMHHNAVVKQVANWLRTDKDEILSDVALRQTEMSPLVSNIIVKVADNIEARFLQKDCRTVQRDNNRNQP